MEVDLITILHIFSFMLISLGIFLLVKSLNKRKEKLQQEILRDNLREMSVVNNVNDFLTYDKETILNSPEFKRVHDNYKPDDYPNIVGILKEFVRPYKPFEYYKIHNNIRKLSGADKINTSNCYRQSITASAIIFNLTIPRMLSTSDLSVLTYCSFYLKLTELVNYDEQMQQYIKNEYHNADSDLVTKIP